LDDTLILNDKSCALHRDDAGWHLDVGGFIELLAKDLALLPAGPGRIIGNVDIHAHPSAVPRLPSPLRVEGNLLIESSRHLRLPEQLRVSGDLTLSNSEMASDALPSSLHVGGALFINGCPFQTLPEDLHIGRSLIADESALRHLPAGLQLSGSLNIADTCIDTLPPELRVGSALLLKNTPISDLAPELLVGLETLDIGGTGIERLPDDLTLRHSLWVEGPSKLKTLPERLDVWGLAMSHSHIAALPETTRIHGFLQANHTALKALPRGVRVLRDSLALVGSAIEHLPSGLRIDGDCFLADSLIQQLPEDMVVGGYLYIGGTAVADLPAPAGCRNVDRRWRPG
jgi:hypothetical protein